MMNENNNTLTDYFPFNRMEKHVLSYPECELNNCAFLRSLSRNIIAQIRGTKYDVTKDRDTLCEVSLKRATSKIFPNI